MMQMAPALGKRESAIDLANSQASFGLKKVCVVAAQQQKCCATVSVVIPNYNYARYLPEAVHSALSQPGVSIDVIIVDDASTDNSVELARELAAKDRRIRLLVHRKNAGPVTTFND